MVPLPNDPDEPLTHTLFKQIHALAAQANAAFTELLADLDLTEALANALWHLDPRVPPPSMRALAATLGCDPSTVTFLTQRLRQRDLVRLDVAAGDRRIKTISLTAKGVRARARLVDAVASRSPLARLTADEQHTLYTLLAKTGVTPDRIDHAL
ncbi:MarR family winged helix-turn-helix transcriptional regulator [Yinghuangia seranimata]|uniref:MarR family winged helix-turn-helix transcriptional regulator n=1 Tax=Yinghuangia seranimata TaxID=408067 RepID=UPI00248B98AF|nr:MarR family winged helix-turn-helix transcriptional regulator [Yinghuangia seranimata]MDI2129537.1 MarR family winged helix-turn-helix transcriptional regulator [Yinghuangia seranimata]